MPRNRRLQYPSRDSVDHFPYPFGSWYAPGFEYYPQVPECKFYGGSDRNFLVSDNLFTRVVQSNVEMNLQPLIKVLDTEYLHSYTAVVYNVDEHGGPRDNSTPDVSRKQGGPTVNCTLQVTNFPFCYGGTWVPIVHLQGKSCFNLFGLYLWIQDPWGGNNNLIPHAHPPEGLFNIISTICLQVVPVCPAKWGISSGQKHDPGLVYDNYCKDSRSWQNYGCSYEN